MALEKGRELSRVEMIGIVERRGALSGELPGQRSFMLQAERADPVSEAASAPFEPEMLELGHPVTHLEGTEAMHVAIAERTPVVEADT